MSQIAHIHFGHGSLLLPARDPYDRQVVFEQVEFYARKHGAVALRLGRVAMRVARSEAESRPVCMECGETVGPIDYHVGERRFCSSCVQATAR
jgi:hypothetical protein